MVGAARSLQVALFVMAFVGSANADAIEIYVDVKIETPADPAAPHNVLLAKFRRDFGPQQTQSAENLIAERFISVFNRTRMFRLVRATAQSPRERTVQLRVPVTTSWPSNDHAYLEVYAGDDPIPVDIELFFRTGCNRPARANGEPDCCPESAADASWYTMIFEGLLKQWPDGLLKGLVLTRTAVYERGGFVRTQEELSHFGQRQGAPSALFEITYGTTQRRFAFCQRHQVGTWKALGKDQGTSLSPDCAVLPIPETIQPGVMGVVSIFKWVPPRGP